MRALWLLAALALPGAGQAADLRLGGDPVMGCGMTLEGPIATGDAAALKALIPQMRAELAARGLGVEDPLRYQVAKRLCLTSEGGSLAEGVALARVIHDAGIGTAVPAGAACRSACAVAFMGGADALDPSVPKMPDRVIHPTARLGFHAPALNVPRGRYGAETVGEAYATALASIALLQAEMDVIDFPLSLATTMLATPPDSFWHVETVADATRLGIAVAPLRAPVDFSLMAANLACSHAQSRELDAPFTFLPLITDFAQAAAPGEGVVMEDPDGRAALVEAYLGYGADGQGGCEAWLWDAGVGRAYTRSATSWAGRIRQGGWQPLHRVMLHAPQTRISSLALADDSQPETAEPDPVQQTRRQRGICLIYEDLELREEGPCQRRHELNYAPDLSEASVTTYSLDGAERLRYAWTDQGPLINGEPPAQDYSDYAEDYEREQALRGAALEKAEEAGWGMEAEATCLPLSASGTLCFIRPAPALP